MEENETTVEESERIKELGFDFTPVCEKFLCGPFAEGWSFNTFDRIVVFKDGQLHDVDPDCSLCNYTCTFAGEPKVNNITRAIGRAVDDNSDFWADNVGDNQLYFIPIIPHAILMACFPKRPTIFEGAYEAFIWCTQCYPEETKKQFNKIMEMYK